jgi:hypothetical protein
MWRNAKKKDSGLALEALKLPNIFHHPTLVWRSRALAREEHRLSQSEPRGVEMIFWCFDGAGVGRTFAASSSEPFRFMILDFCRAFSLLVGNFHG